MRRMSLCYRNSIDLGVVTQNKAQNRMQARSQFAKKVTIKTEDEDLCNSGGFGALGGIEI